MARGPLEDTNSDNSFIHSVECCLWIWTSVWYQSHEMNEEALFLLSRSSQSSESETTTSKSSIIHHDGFCANQEKPVTQEPNSPRASSHQCHPFLFMCHRVGLARKCMLTEEERWHGDERVLFPGEVSAAHEHVCLNIENKERHLVQTPHWECNAFDSEQRASQSQKLLPHGQT